MVRDGHAAVHCRDFLLVQYRRPSKTTVAAAGLYRSGVINSSETMASMGDYNSVFKSYLKEVQSTTELNLIPEGNNVDEMYNLNRTPRKSALTRAKRAQLDKSLQDEMNRWRTVENARGKKVRFNMNDHYSEACLLMPRTWMYVYAL